MLLFSEEKKYDLTKYENGYENITTDFFPKTTNKTNYMYYLPAGSLFNIGAI